MGQALLTPPQEIVLKMVASEPNLADFYLTGGTALSAFYLKHRLSDDLDFFAFSEPDRVFLEGFAKKIGNELKASGVRFEKLYDRSQFFFLLDPSELKIEFTKYPFLQLEKSEIKNGIKIDSLRDIAANKLMAILDRFDPKDFVDFYFLLKNFDLNNVRQDTETKFGLKIDSIFLGGELVKARRIEALPKMIKPLAAEELRSFFAVVAAKLAPEIFE